MDLTCPHGQVPVSSEFRVTRVCAQGGDGVKGMGTGVKRRDDHDQGMHAAVVIRKSGRWVFFAPSLPSQPGSLPGLFPYPSFRPSMGRGTRPPRSKAEVMLSNWSSPGSQSAPKAVRKRLAGVEGRTSSTSWLRTRNSAWYGNRGPEEAKSATQLHPTLCSVSQVFPKLQAFPHSPHHLCPNSLYTAQAFHSLPPTL